MIICSLTNGIPDISTLYNITPTGTGVNGRGVCWDAANNFYVSSSGLGLVQEWTLGSTATAVTTGNASGPTSFTLQVPNQTVTAATSQPIASQQPSSAGNPQTATFVISRSGNTTSPLTVNFTLGGTAATTNYTANHTTSVTLLQGYSSSNITITAVNDTTP